LHLAYSSIPSIFNDTFGMGYLFVMMVSLILSLIEVDVLVMLLARIMGFFGLLVS
jgi:hypothetical protein